MRVGFHSDSFSLRGVTVATLAYARSWQQLGHESVLIKCDGHTPWIVDRERISLAKGLPIVRYESPESLNKVLEDAGIEALYVLCDGQPQARFQKLTIPLWIHAVFPAKISEVHGDRYACISDWLAQESFNSQIDVVPHSVETLANEAKRNSWRDSFGIPADAIVIGSMGGSYSFDLSIARKGLKRALDKKDNLYFAALNHHPFLTHERALFLPGTDELDAKSAFISSCDAMLHGRTQGETFGLACAEFTAAGKPVFAWRHAPERHHLEHFCPPELNYSKELDLCNKILEFDPQHWDITTLQKRCDPFRPEVVAHQFERVFASSKSTSPSPRFTSTDRALIFKRRLQRSIRARLSQVHRQEPNQSLITIDPASGFPMEE